MNLTYNVIIKFNKKNIYKIKKSNKKKTKYDKIKTNLIVEIYKYEYINKKNQTNEIIHIDHNINV